MGAVVTHQKDVIAGGEEHIFASPRKYRPSRDGRRRLILVCHGANQTAVEVTTGDPITQPWMRQLTDAGFLVLAINCEAPPAASGKQNWGNAASSIRLQAAIDWAVANAGAKADGVGAITVSMGAITLLNWARTRPGALRAAALMIPGLDLQDLRDNNRFGSQPFIDAAYGGSGNLPAAYPTRSPAVYRDELRGLPLRLWTSSTDPVALPSVSSAFAAGLGIKNRNIGAVGHAITGIDFSEVTGYLNTYAK